MESNRLETLTLRIKKQFLEKIISGEKTIEYRENTFYYWDRIGEREFQFVHFFCPMVRTGKVLRATFEIVEIELNIENNRYEIYLGKQIV